MAEPLLAFQDVALSSEEGRVIFTGLRWSLGRGLHLNLRAAFGSDVTALLRLAAGLVQPQGGQVLLDRIPLGPYTFDHPFLRRGALGWVPREGGLLVNQSLLANLSLPLRFTKRMAPREAESAAGQALERAGLAEKAGHRPHALEPGERWLGALLRAELMEPELWLVDEPSGDLERTWQLAAAALLERAVSSPALVVVAGNHSWIPQTSVQRIRLENGQPVAEGT